MYKKEKDIFSNNQEPRYLFVPESNSNWVISASIAGQSTTEAFIKSCKAANRPDSDFAGKCEQMGITRWRHKDREGLWQEGGIGVKCDLSRKRRESGDEEGNKWIEGDISVTAA